MGGWILRGDMGREKAGKRIYVTSVMRMTGCGRITILGSEL